MPRSPLSRQAEQSPFKARLAREVYWRVTVEFRSLPVEPGDDPLRVPYVSQQPHQPNSQTQLVWRRTPVFPQALQVAGRDAGKARLIRLGDTGKRLLQVGH